jgi:predicted MFS family arabinose efflux permease
VLTVAFGVGGLVGALLVTVFPLRGEPERLALRLFAAVAAATGLCAFAPAYGFALAGFAVIGLVNAAAFTATLAARTKYAPPYARAQVFVTSAGVKVALASVGAAVTGMAAGLGGRVLLLLAAGITTASVVAAVADRVLGGQGTSPPPSRDQAA